MWTNYLRKWLNALRTEAAWIGILLQLLSPVIQLRAK